MNRAVAVCWLALIQSAAGADMAKMTRCETHPGDKHSYWSYREITGRKCWFRGHPGSKEKSQLFWGRDETKPDVKAELPAVEEPPEPEPSIAVIRARPGDMSDWQWRGLWEVWMNHRSMREWRLP